MAANPFNGLLVVVAQDGWRQSYSFTVSDVAAEYWKWEDGVATSLVLPANHGDISVVDIILTEAGTDTTVATIYVNGVTTGQKVRNAQNQYTTVPQGRQFFGTPLRLAPGSTIKFVQAAS